MGRRRRPDLPGTIFHLVARTIRREHWFTPPVRNAILRSVLAVVPHSGVRLLAVTVMSNHIHLVVQQGERRVDALMQPLLRRAAGHVHVVHGITGPVFSGRYRHRACFSPDYARTLIAYVHLNPVRAGICADPGDFPWTTHALYDPESDMGTSRADILRPVVDPSLVLPLFATQPDPSSAQLRSDYRAFLARCLARDRGEIDPAEADPATFNTLRTPLFRGTWPVAPHSSSACPPPGQPGRPERPGGPCESGWCPPLDRPDAVDVARQVLAEAGSPVSLDQLRGRGGGRLLSALRRQVIRRLSDAGHRNIDIARLLGLADSTVSGILRADSGNGRS